MLKGRCGFILIILASITSLGWVNPQADITLKGNRLYEEGKYDQALEKYGQALIELPENPILHFNMGNAAYKKEDYQQAETWYSKVLNSGDAWLQAKANYNLGNCEYRQGKLKENTNLAEAIELYRQALSYYKQAIELNPDDKDAKFNHEFVERHIKELMSRLNQQQKEKKQQKRPSQSQSQDQQQQPSSAESRKTEDNKEPSEKTQPEQKQSEQVQEDDVQAGQEQEEKQVASNEAGDISPDEEKREMSREEACRLLDSLQDEELRQLKQPRGGYRTRQVYKDW